MARNKSILKNTSVSVAQRKHNCRRSKKHHILAGEPRLTIKEGRSVQHYCKECGATSLNTAISLVEQLKNELLK